MNVGPGGPRRLRSAWERKSGQRTAPAPAGVSPDAPQGRPLLPSDFSLPSPWPALQFPALPRRPHNHGTSQHRSPTNSVPLTERAVPHGLCSGGRRCGNRYAEQGGGFGTAQETQERGSCSMRADSRRKSGHPVLTGLRAMGSCV